MNTVYSMFLHGSVLSALSQIRGKLVRTYMMCLLRTEKQIQKSSPAGKREGPRVRVRALLFFCGSYSGLFRKCIWF